VLSGCTWTMQLVVHRARNPAAPGTGYGLRRLVPSADPLAVVPAAAMSGNLAVWLPFTRTHLPLHSL
jgi:hypothetical protein